ncbi:MAG: pcp [Amycolatopsis sp.]|jgi:pyroglutamyl-peptidase|nr:pcp [Amycolatopsis sp.]
MTGTARPGGHHIVLVTGFGPFGKHLDNPSGDLARRLDGATVAGATVVGRIFETSTDTIGANLAGALDELAPDLLICLGIAPGRPALSLERIAINVRDFPLPDHSGVTVADEPVVTGGPDGVFSRLPLASILRRWRKDDVPCHVSNTAGTYLCNQLFYLACRQGRDRGIPAGFIHIPDTPRSAAVAEPGREPGATMSLDVMVAALLSAIEVCLEERGDQVALTAGAVA